ncbi:hypothetical protein [Engelhardtia mirabilis]|uniref:Tetratricopeptide repeat protein n=1 Tax=Engelhardtia mirabilis TaxID=2528011 RepID=A0A518BIY3_9BACT|nr:Tetratricopeptide repeat protein [Planctomycetes bacterium Pla133]QDV01242.1 Tetratricopeptide repeat protein [Planctomycetes bacterium Pla86]
MRRLQASVWFLLTLLTVGGFGPGADAAQRGSRPSQGGPAPSRPAPSPAPQSRPAPAPAPQSRPAPSRPTPAPTGSTSRTNYGSSSSRSSSPAPVTSSSSYGSSSSSRDASTPRVIRLSPSEASDAGYLVSPSAERAPAPASSRVDEAPSAVDLRSSASSSGSSAPAAVSAERGAASFPRTSSTSSEGMIVIEPSQRPVHVPVPAPYRGSSPVDVSRPEAQRAVDRYRDAVETGEWARLRSKLDGGSPLRLTTARNLDRLMERYSRVPAASESSVRGGSGLDDRYSARAYRYAYDRGPIDRLERPDAEPPARAAAEASREQAARIQDAREKTARVQAARSKTARVQNAREEASLAESQAIRRDQARAIPGQSPLLAREADPLRRFAEQRGEDTSRMVDREAPSRRALAGMTALADDNPAAARELAASGLAIARATRASLSLAAGSVAGAVAGAAVDQAAAGSEPPGYSSYPDYYWDDCWYFDLGLSFYWGPNGYGPYAYLGYGGYASPYGYSFCHPYWYNPYCNWGFGYYGHPYGYSWCPSIYYSSALYHNSYYGGAYYSGGYYGGYYGGYQSQPVVIVEQPAEVAPTIVIIEQPAAAAPAAAPAPDGGPIGRGSVPLSVSTAADSYLTLGDRAFREGRFADAVHFYAKATELEPDVAVFYLVLSDALFATGDYGYAAFSIRKALELEPELIESEVDKRNFYSDPLEFDRQLAVLELYLEDHPADDEARLVLAANLLFSGAPASAVDLLDNALAVGLAQDQAAGVILARSQTLQYGG